MRKERFVRRFFEENQNSQSLQALFELVRDDHTSNPSAESTNLIVDTMKKIITKASIVLLPTASSSRYNQIYNGPYGYDWSIPHPQQNRANFENLFTMVADYCYANGHGDLIRTGLQGVMQNSSWSSSSELVRLVSSYVGREAAVDGQDAWYKWYSSGSLRFAHCWC